MLIEQALMTKLGTDLVAQLSTRIYFVKAPQNVTAPYLTFQKVSAVRGHAHDGPDGSVESRFQFNVFAATYKECKDTMEALRASLDGFTGVMGGAGGVTVGRCFYDMETDLWEEEVAPGGLYGIAADYLILYLE